jgi:hypothetical protein
MLELRQLTPTRNPIPAAYEKERASVCSKLLMLQNDQYQVYYRRVGRERSRKAGRQPGFELHLCDACADFRLVLLRRLAAQRLDS